MPRIKTIEQLERELAAQKKQVASLQIRRAKLLTRLAKLDKSIASLTGMHTGLAGEPKGKPWRRVAKMGKAHGKGGKSLPECIHNALAAEAKPMRVKAVQQAVLDAGYKTASKKGFYGMVAAALRDKKRFARVSRGVYKLA